MPSPPDLNPAVTHIVDHLLRFPPGVALALIFAIPAAEASVFAGFFFPGEIAILLGGVLANQGRLPLWSVIVVGTLGAAIGDSIGYEVGRHYGMRLLDKVPKRLLKPEHIERTQRLLRTKGGRAVFIGRFTAALRVLVPGLAGVSRLDYRRFLFFNVTGALAWVTETAIVGYIVGKSYKAAEHRLSLISLAILGLALLFFAYRYARHSSSLQSWLRQHFGWAYRLDRTLLVAFTLAVGGGWLLGGVSQDVTAHEGVTTADPRILHDVISHRGPVLTPLAKVVTTFGTSPVAYTFVVVAGVLAARTRHRWWPFAFAVGVLLSGQLVRLLLNRGIGRARPPRDLWLMHAGGYSFPSGHTTTATLAYVVVAALLVLRWPKRRIVIFAAAGVCAIAVGLSRVYLGVHWPTDVLGGWLLAATWLALCALTYRVFRVVQSRRATLIAT